MLVVPSLDHRFHWSSAVPFFAIVVGDIFVALGFLVIFFVYKVKYFYLSNY